VIFTTADFAVEFSADIYLDTTPTGGYLPFYVKTPPLLNSLTYQWQSEFNNFI
jgi:hypothetical protein